MVDSDNESPEIRKRFIENEDKATNEEIVAQQQPEEELKSDESKEAFSEEFDEKEIEDGDEKGTATCKPRITVYGGIRNLQPLQRPSFIARQAKNVKIFFTELFDFIFLL